MWYMLQHTVHTTPKSVPTFWRFWSKSCACTEYDNGLTTRARTVVKIWPKPTFKMCSLFLSKTWHFHCFWVFFMVFDCFWVIHLLCLYGHSLKSQNHHFLHHFGLVSSHCRCLKYATAKGSKSGKNTERDEVACPRFACFGCFAWLWSMRGLV